jgi:hypothetical protein
MINVSIKSEHKVNELTDVESKKLPTPSQQYRRKINM